MDQPGGKVIANCQYRRNDAGPDCGPTLRRFRIEPFADPVHRNEQDGQCQEIGDDSTQTGSSENKKSDGGDRMVERGVRMRSLKELEEKSGNLAPHQRLV